MSARLVARGLVLRRGGKAVLDGVDLDAVPGRLLALVGPNGAGKSTLLDALAGLLAPDAGYVHLDDKPLEAVPRLVLAQRLACLGQAEQPDVELTALEVALLGRSPHLGPWGLPSPEDVELAQAALVRTDAVALAGRRLATLSGGERQRVLLARALCQRGEVLLMDEPTHSLDPGHAFHVMEQLRAEVSRGAAAVVALHDLALAAAFSDEVAVLHHGQVRARGPWQQALCPEVLAAAFGLPMEMVQVRGRPVVVMAPA